MNVTLKDIGCKLSKTSKTLKHFGREAVLLGTMTTATAVAGFILTGPSLSRDAHRKVADYVTTYAEMPKYDLNPLEYAGNYGKAQVALDSAKVWQENPVLGEIEYPRETNSTSYKINNILKEMNKNNEVIKDLANNIN